MNNYRKDLSSKQRELIVAAFRGSEGGTYMAQGKSNQGFMLDQPGVSAEEFRKWIGGNVVAYVGSKYVRIEGSGRVQDELKGLCEKVLSEA